jgi:hypothetical protein
MKVNAKTLLMTCVACLGAAGVSHAQEQAAPPMPEMAQPRDEHKKLEQFAGEWIGECKMEMPGQDEPMVCSGTETSRMMGGLWLVATGESTTEGMEGESMITLGYDPKKGSYVGTFVCSAQDYIWHYTGKFDDTGKKLILSTEGPSMLEPGKTAKYEEVLETVDADHKTFSSSIQLADGKWQELMKMNYTRKK